jgi:DNA ligase (NAD+)
LQKAGDVIPDIVKVLTELRPTKNGKPVPAYRFPTHVAECGGDGSIERVPGQAAYRCVFRGGAAEHRRKLYHFVSKKCFDIDGLGPRQIDAFIENNLISAYDDIFTLKKGDLLALPRFAELSTDNLIQAIDKAREVTLPRFLASLSIPQVGEETAYDVAKHFTESAGAQAALESIMHAKAGDFQSIYGVGEVVAQSLELWFASSDNRKLVANLLKHIRVITESVSGNKKTRRQVIRIYRYYADSRS